MNEGNEVKPSGAFLIEYPYNDNRECVRSRTDIILKTYISLEKRVGCIFLLGLLARAVQENVRINTNTWSKSLNNDPTQTWI